jgi:chaperonin GroES
MYSSSSVMGRVSHAPLKAAVQTVTGKMELLHDNILVKLADSKDTSVGGIILSDGAKEKVREGAVVVVGPGAVHMETGNVFDMSVSVGENVAFGQYSGTEINYNGAPHQIIADADVLYKYASGILSDDIDNFQCVQDYVLVKLDAEEEKSSGGVIVASASGASNKRVTSGTVVKIGPGRKAIANPSKVIPMPVAIQDKVNFREYASTEVKKVKGIRYVVVKAADIVAKM